MSKAQDLDWTAKARADARLSSRCHYKGRLASNNAIFDSSYERGRPLSFKVGVRQVIAGDAHPCMPGGAHMGPPVRTDHVQDV